MHWYLVHTKPKQEKCAFQNLQQQGYRCYLPMLPVEKLHLGNLTVVDEPLFPRYLLFNWSRAIPPKAGCRSVPPEVSTGWYVSDLNLPGSMIF